MIGLVFWAQSSAEATLAEAMAFGVQAGQLGIPGDLDLTGQAEQWLHALAESPFQIVTAVCAYKGEDYTDIARVESTVGLVPLNTRTERITRTREVSTFAARLGIPSVACHIGALPHTIDPAIRDLTRDICDHCAAHQQTFALETGQEPAAILLEFLHAVDRPNLKINFDPANMVLYGSGDPLHALDLLAPYVVSVHCKDGDPPTAPGALGIERPLGQGSVDVPAFLDKLKALRYHGILSIEREEPDPSVRADGIRQAISLLQRHA